MSFISLSFAVLFAVALLARFTIGRTGRGFAYLLVLLVLSVVFYGWHIPAYLSILLISTLIDYWAAIAIAAPSASARRRKVLLAVSMATNLGMLGFFKYVDFAIDVVQKGLAAVGVDASISTLGIVLPMGISFYTFQSMSYTIDVYRRRQEVERRFWRFFLYVVFFPQLVAGPIVRATDFLYQLRRKRSPRFVVIGEGVFLIAQGMMLKMVCADNIGPIVDEYWRVAVRGAGNSATNLCLAVLFSAQIFCDFAGYSRIARGAAYLLGYRLPVNFNNPYIAVSFSDFWRRWHMTLSQWLRDYLYVPLGGNRRGPVRTYINLLIVMTLGGLWHGAAMHFVVWGVMHGLALAFERLIGLADPSRHRRGVAIAWFIVVQLGVLATWIVFRATGMREVGAFFAGLFSGGTSLISSNLLLAMAFTAPVVVMHTRGWLVERKMVAAVGPREKAVLAALMFLMVLVLYGESGAFIYFQF